MDTAFTFKHLEKLNNLKLENFASCHLEHAEKKGKHLYKENDLIRDIATFMEHPESFTFYKKYMNAKNFNYVISLLKVYDMISKMLEKSSYEFNAYHKIFILYALLNNPNYSRIILKNTKKIPFLL